jgi:hypothetical protein
MDADPELAAMIERFIPDIRAQLQLPRITPSRARCG